MSQESLYFYLDASKYKINSLYMYHFLFMIFLNNRLKENMDMLLISFQKINEYMNYKTITTLFIIFSMISLINLLSPVFAQQQ